MLAALSPLRGSPPHDGAADGDLDDLLALLAPHGAWQAPGAGEAPQDEDAGVQEEDGAALRCIDGTHAPGCTRCTAPPEEEQEAGHELTGDAGKKNGEKRRVGCFCTRFSARRVR